MEPLSSLKSKVDTILELLERSYPEVKVPLNYSNPLELLIATILSAQCTDKKVNEVTKKLFKRYKTAKDYAEAELSVLENDIREINFYKNKAKNIKACCQQLVEKYHGNVPADLEKLTALPGVGRKTANVVLGAAFGIPAIVVDTHVKRVSQRLGLTKNTAPEKIERDLMRLIPQRHWTKFSLQLIIHGRTICKSRRPRCEICPLQSVCAYFQNQGKSLDKGKPRGR